MKKILLFGTGFIANNFIDYIQDNFDDYEIIVLYHTHRISNKNIRCYSMQSNIDEIFIKENPEYVICLHGSSFVAANTDVIASIETNALKTIRFLDTIHKNRLHDTIKNILVIGSASEYGKMYNKAIQEEFELLPTSVYGLSKIYLYNGAMYYTKRGLPITYVRQFNTIGSGQRKEFVLPSFCNEILDIKEGIKSDLSVGDLSQERDFIDVRDTCRAYMTLLEKGRIGETYNVASGRYITIKNLLDTVIEHADIDADSITIHENPNLFSKEESLCKRLHADISKLEALGFKHRYTLDDTVKDALQYWRENV